MYIFYIFIIVCGYTHYELEKLKRVFADCGGNKIHHRFHGPSILQPPNTLKRAHIPRDMAHSCHSIIFQNRNEVWLFSCHRFRMIDWCIIQPTNWFYLCLQVLWFKPSNCWWLQNQTQPFSFVFGVPVYANVNKNNIYKKRNSKREKKERYETKNGGGGEVRAPFR